MLTILIEDKTPIIRANKSDLVFSLLRAYFGKKLDKTNLERTLEKYHKGALKKAQKKKVGAVTINIKGLDFADDGASFEITFNGKMSNKKLIEEAFILEGFREQIKEHPKISKIKKLVFTTEMRLHVASFDESKLKTHNLRDVKEVAMTYYDV